MKLHKGALEMLSTELFIATFSRRYKIALLVIALAITASFVILTEQQTKQKDSANIINIAGEQRMLSQRIALLIFNIQASPKSNIDTFTKLQHARNKIINNQKYLEKKLHLVDIELKQLLESYFYGDIKLVERVEKYAELAQDIINKKKQTFTEFEQFNREQLLIDLHQVVILFEKSSDTQQISLSLIHI